MIIIKSVKVFKTCNIEIGLVLLCHAGETVN